MLFIITRGPHCLRAQTLIRQQIWLLTSRPHFGCLTPRDDAEVVFASSGGTVYGAPLEFPVPEVHPLAPITAYGAGKAGAEIYLNLYRSLHRVDCRIARLANPYGAGQNTERGQGAVSAFLGKALRNEPIVIWGDGAIVRDYIHI